MKPGDLVVTWRSHSVHDVKDPTFSSRGRSRAWEPGQPATIVSQSTRDVKGVEIRKLQILLDGELWWTGAGAVRVLESQDESR
jgi:hypothetical protein